MKIFVIISFITSSLSYGHSTENMDRHLMEKFSSQDRLSPSLPCLCAKNQHDVSFNNPLQKGHRSPLIPEKRLLPSPRLSNMDAKERKERLDESMARFMQLMTFFGHVDNFLTQKTSGLLKTMGKAVAADEYDEDYEPHYRPTKRTAPTITNSMSS